MILINISINDLKQQRSIIRSTRTSLKFQFHPERLVQNYNSWMTTSKS